MKKILLSIFVLSATFASAQNNQTNNAKDLNVVSLEISGDVGNNIGIAIEHAKAQENNDQYKISTVIRAYYVSTKLESDNQSVKDVNGSGIGLEIGFRTYFNKEAYKGFYAGSNFTTGTIKFEEDNVYKENIFGVQDNFSGKYKYLSFFAPEIGYKFLIAKSVAVNLHVGTSWIIERKGEGDIDNQMFDNWVARAGLSVGYTF
ncbi:hypothetical protein ES677_01525 [Bizionia gelidisalsuginis]|uniref:DUF3575 domain-containing protein n=1 Tax=Bizionia gelidisalsuginis TaxID=291188 RepID=A0ABY3MER6_9FLAO|nr:hypothetical protein [Bizionia gelidisalsuginis]TYC18085.1 hypothetical protein ES677_01525 [Bizionia gelidisalsuginis]